MFSLRRLSIGLGFLLIPLVVTTVPALAQVPVASPTPTGQPISVIPVVPDNAYIVYGPDINAGIAQVGTTHCIIDQASVTGTVDGNIQEVAVRLTVNGRRGVSC